MSQKCVLGRWGRGNDREQPSTHYTLPALYAHKMVAQGKALTSLIASPLGSPLLLQHSSGRRLSALGTIDVSKG